MYGSLLESYQSLPEHSSLLELCLDFLGLILLVNSFLIRLYAYISTGAKRTVPRMVPALSARFLERANGAKGSSAFRAYKLKH